jgi:small subunit ribosomal protein S6
MPLYESVFIARQDVSAQEVEALTERFQGIISEFGGEIAQHEYWGLKGLAYRIKKKRKGHYTMLRMDAPPAAVQEMERNMRISEDILRYLTVRINALDEEPSAMMQTRSARDERRREDRRSRTTSNEPTKLEKGKPTSDADSSQTSESEA